MMGHAGFDAVVIDWQHGVGVSQESVVACIQAIGSSDAVPIVRLPRNSPEYISYVLDAGAYGVIVPMVNTYEEAEAAGRACRYAPRGCRSIAGNRPTLSEPLEEYVQRANDEVICLVMVETTKALENVKAIARAPEIDGLYIGPSDLSLDMGLSLSIGTMTTAISRPCSASLRLRRRTVSWRVIMVPGRAFRPNL
jgi:4-hydroxy-2-oxoheptanedioate aldolase